MTQLILLQAGGGILSTTWPLLLLPLVFYFFLIRPQSQKQKDQDAFSTSLQKGDEVVTHSGIVGRINKMDDSILTIETTDKTYIRVLRSAISKEMTALLNK
jgi:preprotein translocase subunit YajC